VIFFSFDGWGTGGYQMEKQKIKKAFFAASVSIVTLLVIIPLIAVLMLTNAYDNQIRNETNKRAFAKQQAVQAFMDGVFRLSYELALTPCMLTMDSDVQEPLLRDMAARYDYIELLYITGTDGIQTARSEGDLGDRSERFWFRQMMALRSAFVSNSYHSIHTDKPCVSIFVPMIVGAEMVGIFGMDINLDYLQNLVEQYTSVANGQYSFIIDGEGIIIAHPDDTYLARHINIKSLNRDNGNVSGNIRHNPDGTFIIDDEIFGMSECFQTVIEAVMGGESGFSLVNDGGDTFYVSYKPIQLPGDSNSWSIITLQSRNDAMGVISRLVVRILLIIAAIITLFIVLISIFYKSLKNTMHSLESAKDESEKQLFKINLVSKATNIGLWHMDVNNENPVNPQAPIVWTSGFRQFLGYTDENDFPNVLNSINKCIHPEDKEWIFDTLAAHLLDKTGRTPFNVEYRLIKKSGELAFVQDTSETIRDEAGNAVFSVGAIRDITETKTFMIELETERTMLQTMFDSIPDFIFCKDLDLNYTRCNKSILNYFNVTMEELIGKDDAKGLKVSNELAEKYRAMDRAVINDKKLYIYESYIPARDGSVRLFETNKIPLLMNGNVVGILGISRDITERKAMEEAAKNANKAKSHFLSTMSHEIRTPLNAILGITEIILHNNNPDRDVREAVEKIYTSGELLLGIINDILDLSKIEAGKMELHIKRYEIASLISDTAQLNVMRIGSKPIDFELHIDETMPAFLSGDEQRIKQVLNNLLSNAFKYTQEGTVKLTVTAKADETTPDEDKVILVVEVTDTGQGMTKEQITNLFDEYTRFNKAMNHSTEGTGLGMSITQNLLRMMDGTITVESQPGIGSTFAVYIPQEKSGPDVLGKEVVENLRLFRTTGNVHMKRVQITREYMPYGNILIVDDVETNTYVAKGLLTPYGLTVDTANSGFAAIEKVKAGNVYDIIFMDHMMPQMDGIEATGRLRDMGYTQPIVALSANAVAGQTDIFLSNGFDDFLSKPIDIRRMNVLLNKLIRDKQPANVLEAARLNAAAQTRPGKPTSGNFLSGKEIDGLDIQKGLERYDGDENTYLSILRSYAGSIRSLLEFIQTFDEKTVLDYKIRVHGIKGASYDIFAAEIGKQAEKLEHAAIDGDLVYIRENNPPFVKATDAFIRRIEDVLSQIEKENPKPKMLEPDLGLLEKLKNACEIYNMKNVEATMGEIDKYQYDKEGELVDWLRKNVDVMNYSEVVERLCEYLNKNG
jgi:PAS domain S-box-containing protein